MLWKSIRSIEGPFNIIKLKVEHQDPHDPLVHASRGLDIRILQHTFDGMGIDFNDQVLHASEIHA